MAFNGKLALVTGGGSGMGQISAWRLAERGATVAILDLNEAGMEKTKQHPKYGHPNIHSYRCDISDNSQVLTIVDRIVTEFGPIDRLTHAAALMPMAKIADMPAEKITQLMRVNYDGTVFIVKAVLPSMLERNSGDIILYGSLAGSIPSPLMGAYSASKFAVQGFTETLIRESKETKLRIILMCPPIVNTPLLDQAESKSWLMSSMAKKSAIEPEIVVNRIEAAIEKGSGIVYPNSRTKLAVWVNKFLPALSWWSMEVLG